ncbi:MAG: methionyl-tRNA formyltransferase [Candidatus Zixiibacteriota bacterium]|nr:MAG: methionyl-tRNA formyltransferase [candidate division Zixibacteria bacterium]
MKVVFFGTPEFAARTLKKVLLSRHRIVGVVCGPDRRKGRGRKIVFPEVKTLALEKGLSILQPEDLKDEGFLRELRDFDADFFCVVAFRILPGEVFEMPPRGCVNLHASLLPKYRGAAPINWAIINGETETGLTTFFIRKKVDTGDILLQRKIAIGPEETFGELHDRMADLGGDLLVETMDKIEIGNFEASAQKNSEATKAPKIYPELGKIEWSRPGNVIHNLVRGLSPKPAAYSFYEGEKIYILRTRIAENREKSNPGEVIYADGKKGLIAGCGAGALEIIQIKPESRKAMSGAEFVRGHRIEKGAFFGE